VNYLIGALVGATLTYGVFMFVWVYCLQRQHDIDHERLKSDEEYVDTQINTLSTMIQEVDRFLKQTRQEMRP
jgi:hypothetical protein